MNGCFDLASLKSWLLSLVIAAFCLDSAVADEGAYTGSKDRLHIYLLIGQSNMAGRAAYTDKESAPIEDAYLWNAKAAWEPASNPLNRHSTIRKGLGAQKLNPGYSFAKVMLKKQRGVSIGMVVNAKGGTRIDQWEKGGHFYGEAVKRAKAAQQTGVLRGILWHQGESDEKNPDGYALKLVKLAEDLRQDLGVADLPFVAGQVKDVPAINEQIAKLPELLKQSAFVSSKGLTTTDRWHFDHESVIELGERYAEAMLKLQK